MAKRHLACVLAMTVAACGPASPGPSVQALLDSYAPSLQIGGRVSTSAHQRYNLRVSPYAGYRDAGYSAGEGISDLVIMVDEHVDDGDPHVSPRARIKSVSLGVADSASIERLVARVDSALGTPTTACYRSSDAGRFIARYWPGESRRGVFLVVRRADSAGPPPRNAITPVGSGTITFGAENLLSPPVQETPETCPGDSA